MPGAVASVLADRFDAPAGVAAYTLAGLAGVSRLVQDRHWASDVAAGAVLGWATGHFISRRRRENRPYLDFFPFADPGTRTYGLLFSGGF